VVQYEYVEIAGQQILFTANQGVFAYITNWWKWF
jgi:hypothetical protein